MRTEPQKLKAVFRVAAFFSAFLLYAQNSFSEATDLSKSELIQKMQEGGLVIFIRHASTIKSQIDARPIDLSNCEKQRNLSEQGKQEASLIGQSFKKYGIKVSEVLTSPFCRCKDTAQLAFKSYEIRENLYYTIGLPPEERKTKSLALHALLSTPPTNGNRIIVSHTSNLKEAAGIWPRVEGGAYIFEPSEGASHNLNYLGSLTPSQWANGN